MNVKRFRKLTGNRESGDGVRLEIDETAATRTEEMMVRSRFRIEAGRGPRMGHPTGEPQSHQRLQDPIDGSPRDPGPPGRKLVVKVVGGRMILPAPKGLVNRTPLPG